MEAKISIICGCSNLDASHVKFTLLLLSALSHNKLREMNILTPALAKSKKCELQQSFADHSHQASIRCLSSCEQLMASGSADETIYLYDMMTRKETGVLMQHNGTVTCLAFSNNGSHLFSGSEDGSITIFRTGNWQVEKVWPKAHKGEGVTYISIHPSGKLALSVGNDATLRTWNLVKGRQAYATNLGKQRTLGGKAVSSLLWSPEGNMYAISIGPEVDVYGVASAGVVYAIKLEKKVTSLCFIQETSLLVGDENGRISLYSITQKKLLHQVQAHENRVKCICCRGTIENPNIVSASSTGEIKLWELKQGGFKTVCKINCGCRITCMVVATRNEVSQNEQRKSKKHKSANENDSKPKKGVKPDHHPDTKRSRNDIARKSSKQHKNVEPLVICTNGQNWSVESVDKIKL